jgi:hypothetical protein
MEAKIDNIKITMSIEEAEKLRNEMQKMIHDIMSMDSQLGGFFEESRLREEYPEVNKLMSILNISENDLPF